EVHVRVVESWQQSLPAGIDHLGMGPPPGLHLLARSNRNDTVAEDGNRFSLRTRRIHRPDMRVLDDKVRRRLSLREDAERATKDYDKLQETLLHLFSELNS